MDTEILEKIFIFFIGLMTCLIILAIGLSIGESVNVNEVEPNCIVYNDKIYCEINNIKGENKNVEKL